MGQQGPGDRCWGQIVGMYLETETWVAGQESDASLAALIPTRRCRTEVLHFQGA